MKTEIDEDVYEQCDGTLTEFCEKQLYEQDPEKCEACRKLHSGN